VLCVATGGIIGILAWILQDVASSGSAQPIGARVWFGLTSLLKFIPVVFLLEEVWFRGVFDSHLHHPGENRGVLSAIYVSALWGSGIIRSFRGINYKPFCRRLPL
jgi:hypothetical protein